MLRHFFLLIVALLSFGSTSASADTIFFDDFEDANVTDWADGAYTNSALNADTPTRTKSVTSGLNGSANGLLLETGMFDKDTNPSWAGTQVAGPNISGALFDGRALSDITMEFDFAITADAGASHLVYFELREAGLGTTHTTGVAPIDLVGGLKTFSFTLDQFQTGNFIAQGGFNAAANKQIYVQIREGWALNGSTRNIDLTMDNFSITAVPEPSSLMILGSIGLLGMMRRRR